MTISVKVLFFEISAKMKSICANSSQTGFVLIDHYSSKSGEWRHVQFDTTQYQEAFAEVQKIEKAMSFITAEVKKKSYDELSHLRLVAKPCPEGNQNNALFYEVWNDTVWNGVLTQNNTIGHLFNQQKYPADRFKV